MASLQKSSSSHRGIDIGESSTVAGTSANPSNPSPTLTRAKISLEERRKAASLRTHSLKTHGKDASHGTPAEQ